ncbi:MAG: hypothetical protein IIZ39_12985 [Blautia sp.]|nr:hypothetical protein [Aeriscardovia sp.]MBQ1492867.1 hypothetical protein [Blautia sp.]
MKTEFLVDGCINPDYDAVKNILTVRPYPLEQAGNSIHKVVGDIALVLYGVLQEDEFQTVGAKVPSGMEEVWGVSQEKMFRDAFETIQPRVISFAHIDGTPLDEWEADGYFCLTTEKKINGAVAIFKPGVAEKISNMIGPFNIVFTSCHEAMIHPVEDLDANDLREIMEDTMRVATEEEDILTHQVYRYSQGKIRPLD